MTDVPTYPILLGGHPRSTPVTVEIAAPYDGKVLGRVCQGGEKEAAEAVDLALQAAPAAAGLSAHGRGEALEQISARLRQEREELARLLAQECGKPLKTSRLEVDRSIFVFQMAAQEARRLGGEVLPLDLAPHGEGRLGMTRRFPLAPILAITPFNFPLLIAAHKIAPCLAVGGTMVLKPPPQTPLSTIRLGEILRESSYPPSALSIVPCPLEVARGLVQHEAFRMITFTGSAEVGWQIRADAGKKHVHLELGGNAGAVIEPDADLRWAAERCAVGGSIYAGQSCISTQRVFVQQSVHGRFLDLLRERVSGLKVGDPLDETTDVGPMIREVDAERVEAWIAEAVAGGAEAVVGGKRDGQFIYPTVLINTTPEMKVNCQEIFAPVITVTPYEDFDEALAAVNDSRFGIQAGVFTKSLPRAFRAFERLEVGAVVINDVPGYRVDHMPYGGVKESGIGREGVRYAMEEMTELRLMILDLQEARR